MASHDLTDLEKQDQDQSYDYCLDSPKIEETKDRNNYEQGQELVTTTNHDHGHDENGNDHNHDESKGDVAEDDDTKDDVAEDNDDDTSTTSTDSSTASGKSNTGTIHVCCKPMIDHLCGKRGVYTGSISRSTGIPHGKGRLEFIKEGCLQQDGDHINECQPSTGYLRPLSLGDEEQFDEGCNGGLKHETGVMQFTKGQFFEGEYKHGKKIKGEMTYQDGSVIKGSCVYDCMQHGPQCQRVVPAERSIYEGEFRDGSFHGHGQLTWNDGGWYVGEWRHGKMHGRGKEIRQYESLAHNDGEWSTGGQPIHSTEITGTVFSSFPLMRDPENLPQVTNEQFAGSYDPNGTYPGGVELVDGKHGTGVMRFADGRVFEGEYFRGQMIHGKMTYKDGSVYGGSWVDGMRHGRGKCIFADGSEYEGEFQGGNFHGHGEMTWNDGGWYLGEWCDGEMHGWGKEIRVV